MSKQLFQKISLYYNSKKLPWIIICLGVILRLVQYLFNRSLWLDESYLALNIIDRTFLELLQPLSYNQGAPIGFLILEKIAVQIFNSSEYVLRLFPFLSGIASIFLFYGVAKHFIKSEAVPIALCLFAISGPLIYYSSELKQYSTDVFITLLILYFVARNIYSKRLTTSNIFFLGVLGATVIWFSHPSVFILAGVGMSLALSSFFRKEWARVARLSISFSFWSISLTLCYMVSMRGLSNNAHMLNYWDGGFMPFPPSSLNDIRWFVDSFFGIFNYPVGLSLSGIAALAFIAGSVSIFLQKKEQFFILILPIFLVLLTSGLHKYPFKGRLLLFIVPTLLLFIAEGVEHIRDNTRNNSAIIGVVFICLLFLTPSLSASYHLIKPRTREEIKPAISFLKEHEQSGDVLYLFLPSRIAYKYYSKRLNVNLNENIVGLHPKDNWVDHINQLNKLRGNKRVWFLFSHVRLYISRGSVNEKFIVNYLDSIGERIESFKTNDASIYLYNLDDQQR